MSFLAGFDEKAPKRRAVPIRHTIRPSDPIPISSLMPDPPDPEPTQVLVTPDPFEERRSKRDAFAREDGATEGSPNYEQRAEEFDRRAIEALAPDAVAASPQEVPAQWQPTPTYGQRVKRPGQSNGAKRPYQRTGTAALAAVATIGEGSALGDGIPDRDGVVAELAWRHKPAAHRLAESLGCEAGTRAYPGGRNAAPARA